MKTFLSIVLGLMLLTSLVGISYATPQVQPAQSNGGETNPCVQLSPNNPNYLSLGCAGAAHQNGNENPPHHTCFAGQKADAVCCPFGIAPNSLQVSDNQGIQIIQADTFNCGG